MGSAALRPGDRIYVAARFERQAEARDVAGELDAAGFIVTSRWLFSPGLQMGDPESAAHWAKLDLSDVSRADVYLLLSDSELGRGGKDFEGGFAYANGMRIVVVGPAAHVFHYLPSVHRIRDLDALRELIRNFGQEK